MKLRAAAKDKDEQDLAKYREQLEVYERTRQHGLSLTDQQIMLSLKLTIEQIEQKMAQIKTTELDRVIAMSLEGVQDQQVAWDQQQVAQDENSDESPQVEDDADL